MYVDCISYFLRVLQGIFVLSGKLFASVQMQCYIIYTFDDGGQERDDVFLWVWSDLPKCYKLQLWTSVARWSVLYVTVSSCNYVLYFAKATFFLMSESLEDAHNNFPEANVTSSN